jgi:hypothetical protein
MVLDHAVEYSAANDKLLPQPALIRNSQVTVIAMHDTESRQVVGDSHFPTGLVFVICATGFFSLCDSLKNSFF